MDIIARLPNWKCLCKLRISATAVGNMELDELNSLSWFLLCSCFTKNKFNYYQLIILQLMNKYCFWLLLLFVDTIVFILHWFVLNKKLANG